MSNRVTWMSAFVLIVTAMVAGWAEAGESLETFLWTWMYFTVIAVLIIWLIREIKLFRRGNQ